MSERTKLTRQKMPRWIWQLRIEGFHVQLKKYIHFLWRQRPDGCNWGRPLRAKYFDRSVPTIARWDAFLEKWHLAWVSGKGTMAHRIGAFPYYFRETWEAKCFGKPTPKARLTNDTPYTAQQKNKLYSAYSSTAAAPQPSAGPQVVREPAAPRESKSQGANPPAPPGGSVGGATRSRAVLESELRSRIVQRLPRPNWRDKKQVMRRHKLIEAMLRCGVKLVLGGMSVDEAVESMFNEERFIIRVRGISWQKMRNSK